MIEVHVSGYLKSVSLLLSEYTTLFYKKENYKLNNYLVYSSLFCIMNRVVYSLNSNILEH